MGLNHLSDSIVLKNHKPESNPARSPLCQLFHHTWTLDSDNNHLTPCLDLVPGRRCRCGSHVIIASDPLNTPGASLAIAGIDTIDAAAWAVQFPALKTW